MITVVVVKNAKKSESLISSNFDFGLINKINVNCVLAKSACQTG